MLTFINLFFLVSYIIYPVSLWFYEGRVIPWKYTSKDEISFTSNFFLIFIFYVFLILGFYVRFSKYNTRLYLKIKQKIDPIKVAVILLILGILAFILFVISYGGLSYVIQNAGAIRGGYVERSNFGAIVNLFTKNIYLSFWILLTIFITSNKNKLVLILLILSLSSSIAVGIIGAGRLDFLMIFIIAYFIIVSIKHKFYFRYLILILPLSLYTILFGKEIFGSIQYGYSGVLNAIEYKREVVGGDLFSGIIQYFAHPFISIQASLDSTESYRFFSDFPYSFLFFLKIFNLQVPETIVYYNTEFLSGIFESDIPAGVVAFSYYNLGILGIIIFGFVFGVVSKVIEDLFISIKQSALGIVLYLFTCYSYGWFVTHAELRINILFMAFSIPLLVLIVFYSKLYSTKSLQGTSI
ncbi:O-antigen polymerase [Paenibacillus sp. YYML68]|uniref:O-antigen polymerase n=1 Tax=Paenibacillus sp. YYML68 TaxID=2909250 RepID=UPI002493A1C7|nr:O-antigen polymerase [Paenibacillus sp. YYML68]